MKRIFLVLVFASAVLAIAGQAPPPASKAERPVSSDFSHQEYLCDPGGCGWVWVCD
jgi:hypothetical protein